MENTGLAIQSLYNVTATRLAQLVEYLSTGECGQTTIQGLKTTGHPCEGWKLSGHYGL